MMNNISIVIPMYNHWALVHQLLYDIHGYCRDVAEIVLVNDCSSEKECFTGAEWWYTSKLLPLRIIENDENLGFIGSSNLGIKKAKSDTIILVSTDVRILDNIAEQVGAILSTNPKAVVGGRYIDWDTGWNQFGSKRFPYLEGWLLACRKSVWEDVGGFDERFKPNDYEDIDFCTTALGKGYNLVGLENPKITHIGGQSIGFSPERIELTNKNKEKFKEKWLSQH